MEKIGRNENCPCLSGKKYKHCCGINPKATAPPATQNAEDTIRLKEAVDFVLSSALDKKSVFVELGVFLLFSDSVGDAWLLEITEADCVQLAREGQLIDVSIDETPETIVVDWTHTFSITKRQLQLTSYRKKIVTVLHNAPTGEIQGAIRRLKKRHSSEVLEKVHLIKSR